MARKTRRRDIRLGDMYPSRTSILQLTLRLGIRVLLTSPKIQHQNRSSQEDLETRYPKHQGHLESPRKL